MTGAELAVTLTCTVLGEILAVLAIVWRVRGAWDATNEELRKLVREVGALIGAEEKEHADLRAADSAVSARLERHLAWHAEAAPRPLGGNFRLPPPRTCAGGGERACWDGRQFRRTREKRTHAGPYRRPPALPAAAG